MKIILFWLTLNFLWKFSSSRYFCTRMDNEKLMVKCTKRVKSRAHACWPLLWSYSCSQCNDTTCFLRYKQRAKRENGKPTHSENKKKIRASKLRRRLWFSLVDVTLELASSLVAEGPFSVVLLSMKNLSSSGTGGVGGHKSRSWRKEEMEKHRQIPRRQWPN